MMVVADPLISAASFLRGVMAWHQPRLRLSLLPWRVSSQEFLGYQTGGYRYKVGTKSPLRSQGPITPPDFKIFKGEMTSFSHIFSAIYLGAPMTPFITIGSGLHFVDTKTNDSPRRAGHPKIVRNPQIDDRITPPNCGSLYFCYSPCRSVGNWKRQILGWIMRGQ